MRERRSQLTEITAVGRTISGYAAKFNTLSHLICEDEPGAPPGEEKRFFETIRPGAFNLAASPRVILNYDHEDQSILGCTDAGTLKLTQDEVGLHFACDLPQRNPMIDVDGLIEAIQRGDLRGCSFAFNTLPGGEEWGQTEDGVRVRALTNIELYDVCPTPNPAYQDTDVAVRSFLRTCQAAEPAVLRFLEHARRKLRLATGG